MQLLIGTSGFSYKEWKGTFYPQDLKADQMLSFYAQHLETVEINNTFYRMPKRDLLQGWAEQVGQNFRFVLKTSQKVTHYKRLKGVEDEMSYLVETAGVLGPRLGALLVQLPPSFKKNLERLRDFLELLGDRKAAFEFRHPSWMEDDVLEELGGRDQALVVAETDESPDPEVRGTASWGYLRLRKSDYSDAELREWAERIAAQGWDRAFVFFKHEQIAPDLAQKLSKATG